MIPLVHWLRPECPIVEAAAYFLKYRVSSAPVTDAEGNLVGIVSDKDVLSIAHIQNAMDRHVANVMRSNVITYDETAPLANVLSFLTRASMRSVVITSSDGHPIGLISRAALVRWFLQNPWATKQSGLESSDASESPEGSPDIVDSALLRISDELSTEAKRLQRYLQDTQTDREPSLIVGGASRMQQLITEMLAGSASARPTGGGLPF
jgi:CBS domain-containing protein